VTDLIPISALQHFVFCPRQCALIHIEGAWAENRLTVEGSLMHARAHADHLGPRGGGRSTSRPRASTDSDDAPPAIIRTVRALALVSESLGIIGKADVVEFHETPIDHSPAAPQTHRHVRGTPYPIEYKRGRPKRHDADLVQLCAQALCLEEMLALPPGTIAHGAIFYARTKHRLVVPIDAALRDRTRAVIHACRAMLNAGVLPRISRQPKCKRCSLVNICLPEATGPSVSASQFVNRHTTSPS